MRGENRLGLTEARLLQPGGVYRVQLSLITKQLVNNPAYVKLDFGAGGIVSVSEFTLVPRQTTNVLADILAPANATKIDLLVGCTYFCNVDETVRIKLLPTRYRVSQKKVYDGLNATPQEFYYHFNEPAVNDAFHSANGKFPYKEFRGHALAKQSSSDGQAHFSFYRQDDITKGRPIIEMTTQQSYADNFENGNNLGPAFSICSGSQVVLTPLYGDPAAMLTGDTYERYFSGSAYNFQDNGSSPNAAIGQFLLQGTAHQGRMALETAAGLGFAPYARADGEVLAQTKSGGSWIDQATLLQPGVFQKDTWYVFMLMLDDSENFLARLWPSQHPEQQTNYRLQMTAGQNWRFALYAQNGQAYLAN